MPWAAVAVAAALLVTTGVAMSLNGVALAADGAYELVRVLASGDAYGSTARLLGAYVHQGPVLLAARAGVTDTNVLTALLGVGFLVIPALAWSVAVVLTRGERLVCAAVVLVAAVCCGMTWFSAVSPIVLAAPLTIVAAAVLWLPGTLRKREVAIALAACLVLVATYETAVLTSGVLAVWAMWRTRRSQSRIDRYGCMAVSALSVLAILVAAEGARSGRNPTHSQSFLYFVVSLEPWPFYLALGGIALAVAGLGPWFGSTLRRALSAVGIAALVVASLAVRPDQVTAFEARGGEAVAALLLMLFLFWRWVDGLPLETARDRYAPALAIGLPLAVVVSMTAVNLRPLAEWSRSLDAFRRSTDAATGVVDVTTVLPPGRRAVVWDWTSSSLSLIVRRDPNSGVLNDPNPAFVPFPPLAAKEELPDRYRWRCSIPC